MIETAIFPAPSYDIDTFLPTTDEVYKSAVAEHQSYLELPESELKEIIWRTLGRIATLEQKARQPLAISPKTAENIGTIWVHSGTGNYDQPFKAQDNPKLIDKKWMGGWDRARLSQAALLARKIAEARSGQPIKSGPTSELAIRKEETMELITEYGPTIVYSGYPSETEFAERLLDRGGIIIPRSKAKIIHKDLKTTRDAVRTFEYPNDECRSKEVAVISHAPHLGSRILHMMQHFKPLSEGSLPYVVPVATPDKGRKEFALMETRGLLYYIFIKNEAAEEPHPYQSLD